MARRHADHQPANPARAHRRQLPGHDLDMPVYRQPGARVELAKAARGKARKVVAQQCGALVPCRVPGNDRGRHDQPGCSAAASGAAAASAASAAIWRRKRATNRSTTSRSVAVNFAGSGGEAAPAFCSTSFIMSNSILVARRLALADSLTICVTIASRLVILRRLPSIVT